jgi:ribosome-binding factor A
MVNPRTLQRIASRIHERAAYCLQFEIKDPRSSFVTITKVELEPDLRAGKIYWSSLGDEAERRRTAHMLEDAAGFIQRQVGRVLETRTIPHLTWHFDDSIEKAAALDQLIADARRHDEEVRGEHGEASGVEAPDDGDGDAA